MKALAAVTSLLLSTALLLVGQGMQLTLLPLRAAANGLSDVLIGTSASSYFLGFVVGCIAIPRLIARVGHIRCFSVLTAVMISSLLSLEMLDPWGYLVSLRFFMGLAISGLYAVIESWLNSQATAESRGRILAIYMFILLAAMAVGQLLINVGPVETPTPFVLAAVFMALAIIPVGLTSRMAPAPVGSTTIHFRLLYRRSRSAFAGALLSGLVVGSFWSLGAVFAAGNGLTQGEVARFISIAILGGALFQYPIGWLSDRIDRRRVLRLLCLGGVLGSATVALSTQQPWHLAAVFLFGSMVMPLYSLSLATAADVAQPGEFMQIGTSVLLLNALGSVSAPLAIGILMTALGSTALFWAFALLCALFAGYLFVQGRSARDIAIAEQVPFTAAASEVAPVSFDLDPRATDQPLESEPPASGAPEPPVREPAP